MGKRHKTNIEEIPEVTGIPDVKDVTDVMELLPEQLALWLKEQGIASYRTGQIMRS